MVPISIRFAVSMLPSEPMAPRWGDERVGYFNTVYKDLGDHRAAGAGRNTDLLNTEVGAAAVLGDLVDCRLLLLLLVVVVVVVVGEAGVGVGSGGGDIRGKSST